MISAQCGLLLGQASRGLASDVAALARKSAAACHCWYSWQDHQQLQHGHCSRSSSSSSIEFSSTPASRGSLQGTSSTGNTGSTGSTGSSSSSNSGSSRDVAASSGTAGDTCKNSSSWDSLERLISTSRGSSSSSGCSGGGNWHRSKLRSAAFCCVPGRAMHSSAVPGAGHVVQQPQPEDPPELTPPAAAIDPFAIVSAEVTAVSERLRHSVVSNVPALKAAADYYFRPGVQGKRLRPTLLLLLASALSGRPEGPSDDWAAPDLRPADEPPQEPRRRAQRVAEIAETIHVASLLHDDVLDDASTRRGVLSLNASAGNKLAILAGDFLLARASVTLASLRNHEVTELMSRVLENLVSGEVMQMTAAADQLGSLDHYMRKTFCKTASLMANSARCVALVAGAPPAACDAAWQYGRHLGLAFQVVDDVLDITGSSSILGKPALNDMKAGIATAPVLLSLQDQPGLLPLVARRFKGSGDVAAAVEMVRAAGGVEHARALATEHAAAAAAQVPLLVPQGACAHSRLCGAALERITERVLTRSK